MYRPPPTTLFRIATGRTTIATPTRNDATARAPWAPKRRWCEGAKAAQTRRTTMKTSAFSRVSASPPIASPRQNHAFSRRDRGDRREMFFSARSACSAVPVFARDPLRPVVVPVGVAHQDAEKRRRADLPHMDEAHGQRSGKNRERPREPLVIGLAVGAFHASMGTALC